MLDIFLMMLNDTASMLDKPSASSKGMLDKFLIILDKRRFILNILRKCRTFQLRYRTFRPSRRGPCWTFSANNKEIKISGISPWRNNLAHPHAEKTFASSDSPFNHGQQRFRSNPKIPLCIARHPKTETNNPKPIASQDLNLFNQTCRPLHRQTAAFSIKPSV